MRIACLHRFAILVENDHATGCLGKLQHVVAHADYATIDGRTVGSGEELAFVVGSSTQVYETVLLTILSRNGSQSVRQRMPPLELSAPESTEVTVDLAVVILEHAGIDRERAADNNTLTVYIKRLRDKIEEDPANPQVIKTVRGMGYLC